MSSEKKNSDKKLKNECPTCKQEMIKHDGRYCKCFESLLPRAGKSSIKAVSVGEDVERFDRGIDYGERPKEISKATVIAKLKSHGLQEYEITLIYDRFFENLTFSQIVEKSGWASVGACSYIYRKVLAKLKRAGFSFK